jgi:hypothetical protein
MLINREGQPGALFKFFKEFSTLRNIHLDSNICRTCTYMEPL